MKVLLKEDVDNLGYAGEVMDVADGYGRNFLIPQELAVKATKSVLKQAGAWRERAAARMVELQKEHEELAARISDVGLEFTARAGETGKLYGSITTADVIEQLNEALGTDIDRRKVVGGPLRQLGEHDVTIRLSRDFQPQVKVTINQFEEEEEVEEEEVEEVAETAEEDEVESAEPEAVAEGSEADVEEIIVDDEDTAEVEQPVDESELEESTDIEEEN